MKLLCEVFGISRQAYHKRVQKAEKLDNQREVLLDLIRPIRKQMPRLGTIKLYAMVKNGMIRNNIIPSMTEQYDPYENAVAERVNGILKDEFDIASGFINHLHAVKEIKSVVETYNTLRPHLSCNMLTPIQAHEFGKYKLKKWGKHKLKISNQ